MYVNTMSYIYLATVVVFGGIFGGYITMTTMTYQFQAIRTMDYLNKISVDEVWWFFGAYILTQIVAGFIGKHYIMDSIYFLMASNIKEWCEDHADVCTNYNILDLA